jgi:hypothetical protein
MEEASKTGQEGLKSPSDNQTDSPFTQNGDRKIKIIIASYLFVLSVILIVCAAKFWPSESQVDDERYLLAIVAIFGALGSMVHALRSFNWHVVLPGRWGVNWLLRYILLPPIGAAIALVFYAIVRAGFYSPKNDTTVVSQASRESLPWIVAAVAALVGMFREAAASKLKDVAQAILKKPRDFRNGEKEKAKG